MNRRDVRCGFLSASVLALVTLGHAHARDATLQSACFPPETLKAVPGEGLVARGDRQFDSASTPKDMLPASPVLQALRGSIRRVELPKGQRLIALTLDFCEQRGEVAGYVGGIIDVLRQEKIPATLFLGGKWMRSHQTRTEQLMTDPLFEIANHSDLHRNMRKLEGATLADEVSAPQRVYEGYRARLATTQCAAKAPDGVQSVAPRLGLFRFPFGACNATSLAAVNDAGLLAIQWDVSTGDPDPHQTADMIVNTLVRRVRAGSIIIAHGNGRGWHTADALPRAIPKLKAMGYTFVTVSELLARGTPVIAESCYDSKPGDTDRYDFLGSLHAKTKAEDAGWITWLPTMSLEPDPAAKPPRRAAAKSREPVHDDAPITKPY